MSDIGGIFTPLDLLAMVLIAGTPGIFVGAAAGAFLWPNRRAAGILMGATTGFVLCLGAVALWIVVMR